MPAYGSSLKPFASSSCGVWFGKSSSAASGSCSASSVLPTPRRKPLGSFSRLAFRLRLPLHFSDRLLSAQVPSFASESSCRSTFSILIPPVRALPKACRFLGWASGWYLMIIAYSPGSIKKSSFISCNDVSVLLRLCSSMVTSAAVYVAAATACTMTFGTKPAINAPSCTTVKIRDAWLESSKSFRNSSHMS